MTGATRQTRFTPLQLDGVGAPAIAKGFYRWRPTHAYDDGTGRVEPIWSPKVIINGASQVRDLPVTPVDLSWAVEVYSEFPDNAGGTLKKTEVIRVPAGGSIADFEDVDVFIRVDPKTLGPIAHPTPAFELRMLAVEAAIAGGVGTGGAPAGTGTAGALKVEDLEDVTAIGIAVGTAGDQAAARSAIGAGTSSLALGTSGSTAAAGTTVGAAEAAQAAADAAAAAAATKASAAGLTALEATVTALAAAVTALQGQTATTTQILTWTDGDITTNGTSYGTYDATRTYHEFRGARDPRIAGYTLAVGDRWIEPDQAPTSLETIKVDDSLLTFTGSWGVGNDAATYNSSDHFTSTTGDKATYTWTCEVNGQVSVISKKAAHHGILTIKIDGVTVGSADLYSANAAYGAKVFTSALLAAGSHTIEISCSGTKNAASTGVVAEVDALELAGAVAGTGGTNPDPPGTPSGALPTGFMRRSGQQIFIEGSSTPWRGTGVNLPWSQGCGSNIGLTPTLAQHTTMFAAAKPNSIYRYFLFGGANLATFDAILNAARPYGHRFIVCLSDRANGCSEPYCGPNPQAFYNGGWISGGWRDNWLTPVVLRYKNEPLVGWWEWVNEPHMDQGVRNFFDACGAYVRNTLGDRHLIGTGTTSEYDNPSGMRNLNSSPYIDLCSQHEYDYTEAPSHWTTADRADAAFAGKPWYVGESGILPSVYAPGTARANQIKAKIVALKAMPDCCGYLYWTGAAPGYDGLSTRMEIAITGSAEINVINTEAF